MTPTSSTPMRIVHVIESFAGGSIVLIILLARQLRHCQHIVIHGERSNEQAKEQVRRLFGERVEFHHWQGAQREINPAKDWQAYRTLLGQLRTLAPAVLHLHCAKAGFLGRMAAAALHLKACIYSPQAAPFLRQDISSSKRKLYIALEKLAARRAGTVVATSPSEQEAFRQLDIPALCIPNGVEVQPEAPSSKVTIEGPLRIVTVGRLTEQKNPSEFARIARHFQGRKDIAFEWIGDGELREEVARAGVHISGWCPHGEVMEKVRQADVYLSTALWEGLPFAVLEAMSLAKPLLLRDCVGNRDCVKSPHNGQLFTRTEDAIHWLGEWRCQASQLDDMGQASWRLCRERYHIEDIGRRFDRLYQQMAAQPLGLQSQARQWDTAATPRR